MSTPTPVRLQRSRAKGSRLVSPNGMWVMCCTRPGVWGNVFLADWIPLDLSLRLYRQAVEGGWNPSLVAHLSDEHCHDIYSRTHAFGKRFRTTRGYSAHDALTLELRGCNLACWCKLCPAHAATGKPLDVECPDCSPCHCDVIGELLVAPALGLPSGQQKGHS